MEEKSPGAYGSDPDFLNILKTFSFLEKE